MGADPQHRACCVVMRVLVGVSVLPCGGMCRCGVNAAAWGSMQTFVFAALWLTVLGVSLVGGCVGVV